MHTSLDAGRRPGRVGANWRRLGRPVVVAVVLALAAGCGAGVPASPSVPLAPLASPADPRSLHGLCPDPLVVQSNWFPTADVAALYQLLGDGYRVNKNHKTVSGRLVSGGLDAGVGLIIRSGGPAIGFQQVPAQMYLDKSITLGMVITDEAIQYSAAQPTTSVLAPLDGDPQILLWDPAGHPGWNSIIDIGQTDAPVVYYQGATYMEYLVGTGILRRRQIDGSYDGTPTRFTSERGSVVVQGYATNEPFVYQHEVAAWGRPVRYQLISETNYPQYANTLAIRTGDRARLDGCLRRLVPLVQQAQVDFLTRPDSTLHRIVDIVRAFDSSFAYSQGNAEFAVRQLRDLGLSGNGNNRTLGDFDTGRLQRMIDIVVPIVAAQRRPVRQPLAPADIATNEYVDPGIGVR
ncbi:MAG TPA: ABC transporter substrate-binding protein [Mycobacteriales bacterium]|nr:ABC transporter substrate-binding protein [Mycobacteriales bacterium]